MQRYSFERTFEIRKKNEIKFDSEKGASQQQQRTVQRKLNNWHESSNNKRQKASKNHTHAIRCDVLQHGCCLYFSSIFVYHSVCSVLSQSDCLCQSVCLWLFILSSFYCVCLLFLVFTCAQFINPLCTPCVYQLHTYLYQRVYFGFLYLE